MNGHCVKWLREEASRCTSSVRPHTLISGTVVRLFNVIQQSQRSAATAAEQLKAQRGSGKPTLPAPSLRKDKKGKQKSNVLGKSTIGALLDETECSTLTTFSDTLQEDEFLSSIREGGKGVGNDILPG